MREAIRKIRSFTPEEIRPQPLVTGDDLIAMGLKPGPLFTKLLGAVEEVPVEWHLVQFRRSQGTGICHGSDRKGA